MSQWITLASELVYDNAPWLRIVKRRVKSPTGQIIPDWHSLELPAFVNVLVRDQAGKFLILQQHKFECESLSTVGGMLEATEHPLQAAKREMLEETGYVSEQWTSLGSFVVDPNRGCGHCHLFFADNASQQSEPEQPDDEQTGISWLTEAELACAISDGRFKAMAWMLCATLGLLSIRASRGGAEL